MALSEAEEKWLERRKILCTHCDLIAPHHDIDNCPGAAMCSLYHARIAVEAEMESGK